MHEACDFNKQTRPAVINELLDSISQIKMNSSGVL